MPVAKSVFPDVDFPPIAEGFGFTTATVRSLDDLKALAPLLAKPSGPILIDCKMTASVAAPFWSEGPGHSPQKNNLLGGAHFLGQLAGLFIFSLDVSQELFTAHIYRLSPQGLQSVFHFC